MTLPLEGLLVIALEQAVAAPMCTCRLADAGARVIKIERPEGDFARGYDKLARPRGGAERGDGESTYFVWLNRGKESVALDLARETDKALLARQRSGDGAVISICMFDAMADWMAVPLMQYDGGQPPKRLRLAHTSIATYGVFKTKDGVDILISIQSDREWRVLAERVLGDKALAADPNFATNIERVKRRAETDGKVAAAFGALDVEALQEKLAAADIAFGRVN